jgi:parallel beta-helix repeat protein
MRTSSPETFLASIHSGTVAVPNVFSGIAVARGASGNRIGTDANGAADAAEANVASGNGYYGVALVDVGTGQNIVAGNVIGTDLSGTRALGNALAGVEIRGAIQNRIGGTTAAEANRIAFNGGEGIYLAETWGNSLLRNSIYANVGLGIDLDRDGVTANDPGDSDDGANRRQNFPCCKPQHSTGTQLTIRAPSTHGPTPTTGSSSFPMPRPTSGNRQGEVFLGAVNITTDGSGNAHLSVLDVSLAGKRTSPQRPPIPKAIHRSLHRRFKQSPAPPTLAITATDAVKAEGNSGSTPFTVHGYPFGPDDGVRPPSIGR